MEDLISRQSALDVLDDFQSNIELGIDDYAEKRKALCDLPSADRPIGHWIDIDTQTYTWKVRCNKCGHERSMMSTQGVYPKFCENCGADMRGEQDD